MTTKTQTCDCCGGDLPILAVWEARRNGEGECNGTVTKGGRCRAFGPDDWEINDMAVTLANHGSKFAGNNVADEADEWVGCDFDAESAEPWLAIGVWNAATAAEFRDADLTPDQVLAAAESLIEGLDDPAEEYTDGDPIYAACNGDISVDAIIAAAD